MSRVILTAPSGRCALHSVNEGTEAGAGEGHTRRRGGARTGAEIAWLRRWCIQWTALTNTVIIPCVRSWLPIACGLGTEVVVTKPRHRKGHRNDHAVP